MKTALISVNHLKITGVTTHVIQLCKFLLKNDIDVTVHVSQPKLYGVPEFEKVTTLLTNLGVKIILDYPNNKHFNLVYLNTGSIHGFSLEHINCDRLIYFVHGEGFNYTNVLKSTELQKLEVITFSEKMTTWVSEQTFYAPRQINHVVEHYSDISQINRKLQNILIVDAHFYQPIASKVLEICNKYELSLRICGGDSLSTNKFNVQEQILKSDLVIGQGGRTLYEAMSLGRNIISYGLNPGCGYINTDNIKECIKTNCSYGNMLPCTDKDSAAQLEQEILKYSYKDSYLNRQYAIENFNQKNFKSLI